MTALDRDPHHNKLRTHVCVCVCVCVGGGVYNRNKSKLPRNVRTSVLLKDGVKVIGVAGIVSVSRGGGGWNGRTSEENHEYEDKQVLTGLV